MIELLGRATSGNVQKVIFMLEELPAAEGLTWVGARPKDADSGLESARLGFSGGILSKLEFVDNFGQTTTISVSKLQKNPRLPADTFKFTPPKGADVVGN